MKKNDNSMNNLSLKARWYRTSCHLIANTLVELISGHAIYIDADQSIYRSQVQFQSIANFANFYTIYARVRVRVQKFHKNVPKGHPTECTPYFACRFFI